ncbi:peregrin-like [Watersipora subatra]|uniref:peregrin-like n=1 Tax=Watersipora subatra TaxID=2589382 RepID=UPI00355C5C8A
MMKYDFDVKTFCNNLKATKPPYECPIPECKRTYKSWSGIQFHMLNFDHDNPDSGSSTPVPSCGKKGLSSAKKRGKFHKGRRSPLPPESSANSHRETLTYAEAQRLVEIDINGKLRRINIFEPLKIVTKTCCKEETVNPVEDVKVETPKSTPVTKKKSQKDCQSSTKKPPSPYKLPEAHFKVLDDYVKPSKTHTKQSGFFRYIEKTAEELDDEVEYDMDDQDAAWLKVINQGRKKSSVCELSTDTFEFIMDRFEKEAHFQSQTSGEDPAESIDEDAVCSICMDGECQNSNVILFCDMCNLAVHQECYGVPYIPEGQWLCRRCLQSPSCGVDCCLCPNKGGAFKQTDCGRWGHVMCAIWIPEVIFANTVFLEPIDGIKNIPAARWKLTCYICKQKGVGACIQCHKTNCYTAFHVTCAQQAGLYMKVESVKSAVPTSPSGLTIRKTAFCDLHSPANMKGSSMVANSESDADTKTAQEKSRLKMRRARKILAEKRNAVPVVSIPMIPEKRVQAIAKKMKIGRKEILLQRLLAYWTLKRQSRNGVPLVRRLQSNQTAKPHDKMLEPMDEKEAASSNQQLKYWKRLRQDLEKARLLVELIRKREKLKREEMRLHSAMVELTLSPLTKFLQKILDDIRELDSTSVFAYPVDVNEVPDYHEYISTPMDLSTIQQKVNDLVYSNLDEFQDDIMLMIRNCMTYNAKDTPFYKSGLRMSDQGGAILRAARRMYDYIGFEDGTGLLLPDRPEGFTNPHEVSQLLSSENVEKMLSDLVAQNLSSDDHLRQLTDQLDMAILHRGRKWRVTKLLRKEILRVRKNASTGPSGQTSEVPSTMDESSAEDTDALAGTPAPHSPKYTKDVIKPDVLELESVSFRKGDDMSVSSGSTEASLIAKPVLASPGNVNRRTAVLFAKKKLPRRQPNSVTSPLVHSPIASKSETALPNEPDTTPLASLKKPIAKTAQNPRTKQSSDSSCENAQATAVSSVTTQTRKRAAEAEFNEPESKKPSTSKSHSDKESFTQYRGEFMSGLLSASELDQISTTDTDASDSESEGTSAEDQATGNISTSSSGRRLRSADDKYSVPLTALDLVWAKCRGYPWYPAMIVDPKMPKGYTFNGVPIPKPPTHVLELQKKFNSPVYLILFFDAKRTWQWLPRDKLEPLGLDSKYDQQKLSDNRKPNIKKAVMNAYEKALRHQRKIDDGDDDDDDDDDDNN